MKTMKHAREEGFRKFVAWDGEYYTSGYRGAYDAGFDAAVKFMVESWALGNDDVEA